MPNLPSKLQNSLLYIIQQANMTGSSPATELTSQLDLALSELSLVALMTSDALEGTKDRTDFLLYNELARLLRDIALLCMDAQECGDAAALPALLRSIRAKADSVAELAGLPKIQPPSESGLVRVSEPKTWTPSELTSIPEPKTWTSALALYPEDDGTERLRAEVRALRELLASLVLERDHLVNVVLRDIEAAYLRELGGLEAEAYQAECDARIRKAKLERMQASLNREEPVREEKINDGIREEYEEYRRIYEEFVRKIFEAAAYVRKREKQREKQKEKTEHTAQEEKAESRDRESTTAEPPPDAPSEDAHDSGLEETEEQELRRLYRRIVKALHPDLHPNQDEADKDLLKRAIVAYKEFDLTTLREIAALLDGDMPTSAEDEAEALKKEKARLLELIRGIRAEIRSIKSRSPYTLKAMLEDPVRLAAEKEKRTDRIDRAKQAAKRYQERIEEILRNHGRADSATEGTGAGGGASQQRPEHSHAL